MSRVLLIWFGCWVWLFESWEGDFKVVQCVGARLSCLSGQDPLWAGFNSPEGDLFQWARPFVVRVQFPRGRFVSLL